MSGHAHIVGDYRYWLTRRWSEGHRMALFVMLNPSTADASLDDPTIRRCVGFAKTWGLDGIRVVNLYALRATDPAELWTHTAPVGPANDYWITTFAEAAVCEETPIVAAWGANARADRVDAVMALPAMRRAQALGLTKDGAPRHPLYMRGDSQLIPFGGGL